MCELEKLVMALGGYDPIALAGVLMPYPGGGGAPAAVTSFCGRTCDSGACCWTCGGAVCSACHADRRAFAARHGSEPGWEPLAS